MHKKKLVDLICNHCKQVVGKALPGAELLHCSKCQSNGKRVVVRKSVA